MRGTDYIPHLSSSSSSSSGGGVTRTECEEPTASQL